MIWFFTGPFLYLAAATLLAGGAYKVVGLARLPRHLRWELYPLPGLCKGSKYEHVDFGRLPRRHDHLEQALYMAKEILLLKKVLLARRDLWVGSMLLHAGLYFGIVFLGLLTASAAWSAIHAAGPAGSGGFGVLAQATAWAGAISACCGLVGSVYLLLLRLANRGLRDLSDNITFLNLVLLGGLFGAGLWAWLADPGFDGAREHLISLLHGAPAPVASPSLASALVLLGVFLVYLPFSRMFHAAAKFFFYHAILWDDEPMRPGSAMERDVAAYLGDRVTWSAAHIRQNMKWCEQLGEPVSEKGPKNDG